MVVNDNIESIDDASRIDVIVGEGLRRGGSLLARHHGIGAPGLDGVLMVILPPEIRVSGGGEVPVLLPPSVLYHRRAADAISPRRLGINPVAKGLVPPHVGVLGLVLNQYPDVGDRPGSYRKGGATETGQGVGPLRYGVHIKAGLGRTGGQGLAEEERPRAFHILVPVVRLVRCLTIYLIFGVVAPFRQSGICAVGYLPVERPVSREPHAVRVILPPQAVPVLRRASGIHCYHHPHLVQLAVIVAGGALDHIEFIVNRAGEHGGEADIRIGIIVDEGVRWPGPFRFHFTVIVKRPSRHGVRQSGLELGRIWCRRTVICPVPLVLIPIKAQGGIVPLAGQLPAGGAAIIPAFSI